LAQDGIGDMATRNADRHRKVSAKKAEKQSKPVKGTPESGKIRLVQSRLATILDDPAQSLRAREGWFDSVAFLISFSPGIPFPGSQIKSKSCGSVFFRRNQFGFLSGAAMGATKQNEQPMTAQLFHIVQSGHFRPGGQIKSKSCGSFFSDEISLILFWGNTLGNKMSNPKRIGLKERPRRTPAARELSQRNSPYNL
jgi:hypothetical protein